MTYFFLPVSTIESRVN